jgi:hypothetical protein
MAGEEAGRHPEERNGEGKRLVGYCEGDCIGNFFMRKEFIGREDRYSQDWKLSLL